MGEIDAKCPYCNAILDQVPTRKKGCTSCGKFIYVRTHPSDRQLILVTEEEAKNLDALKNLNVSQKEYQNTGKALSKKSRMEQECSFWATSITAVNSD